MNNTFEIQGGEKYAMEIGAIRATIGNQEEMIKTLNAFRTKLENEAGNEKQSERIRRIEIPFAITLAQAGMIDYALESVNEDVRQSALQEGGDALLAEVDAAYDEIIRIESAQS